MEEREISIFEILGIIRRYLALILILGILGGLIGYGISTILPNRYETFTTLLVGRPEDYANQQDLNVNDIMLNQKLVGTYGELIKSRTVSDQVIQGLGLEIDYEQFRDQVEVELVEETEIIRIVVRDAHPLRAKDIANDTAAIFAAEVVKVMKIDNIQIIDYAVEPEKPVFPNTTLNTAIGALAGIALGTAIALIRELTNTKIKKAEDIEEQLGIPVIGKIPVFDGRGKK